ncbi:MAG: hypothetical protein HYU99_07265 [Deltaproteobacteria bacterium]|nr:hypothetical protein [Deltaproteobacteria bacterium]
MPDPKPIQSVSEVDLTEADIATRLAHEKADIPLNQMEELARARLVEPLINEHDALQCQSESWWDNVACQFDFVRKAQATLLWDTAMDRNEWLQRNVLRFDDSPGDGRYSEEEVSRLFNECEKENRLTRLSRYRNSFPNL